MAQLPSENIRPYRPAKPGKTGGEVSNTTGYYFDEPEPFNVIMTEDDKKAIQKEES